MRNITEEKIQALQILQNYITIPTNFALKFTRQVTHNNQPVYWLRFERTDGKNQGFNGEHFSATIDISKNLLKGFVYLAADLIEGTLPDCETTFSTAMKFLQLVAPDLLPAQDSIPSLVKGNTVQSGSVGNVELQWIKPHDETIFIDGIAKTVTGMKVKLFIPQTGLWAWVIIGKNQQPIIFERGIFWNNDMSQRTTEKWLHDVWAEKQPV